MKIEEITKSTVEMQMARKVILNILYTNGLLNENMSEMLKPFDLSSEQYNVLRILRGQKSCPANMCVIQERMITKNSNTTRLIDKLLLKEFVTRNVCPENRRKIEVSITQKGLEILEQLDPKLVEYENLFVANLTQKELNLLNELLEKIRTKNQN